MANQPIQQQKDRDLQEVNAEIEEYKNAVAVRQPRPQPDPQNTVSDLPNVQYCSGGKWKSIQSPNVDRQSSQKLKRD